MFASPGAEVGGSVAFNSAISPYLLAKTALPNSPWMAFDRAASDKEIKNPTAQDSERA
jgi:hypothetical protein